MQKNWSNHTVLIVEDDPISKKYFDIILRSSKINIIHVSDGVSAFVNCTRNPNISIVLMDIKIPRIDGRDTTRLIKKYRPEIPVVAQTASALIIEKERCLKFGCDGFIAKPIVPSELLNLIEKVLLINSVRLVNQLEESA